MSKKAEREELNQTLQSMRDEYVQAVPDVVDEEPKIGKEVRIGGKKPRWVYAGLSVLAVAFLFLGLFINQQRFADETAVGEIAEETAVQSQPASAPIPPPPPLVSEPPIPQDAVPVPPEFTPIPTPPIDNNSPAPGG
ncbi:MAG: hypothetical protein ACE5FD_07575 [Anaerolineae bacterium]